MVDKPNDSEPAPKKKTVFETAELKRKSNEAKRKLEQKNPKSNEKK